MLQSDHFTICHPAHGDLCPPLSRVLLARYGHLVDNRMMWGRCGWDVLDGAGIASTAEGMNLIPGRGRSCVLSSVAEEKKKKDI